MENMGPRNRTKSQSSVDKQNHGENSDEKTDADMNRNIDNIQGPYSGPRLTLLPEGGKGLTYRNFGVDGFHPMNGDARRLLGLPEDYQREQKNLVIWRRPFKTLQFFILECYTLLKIYGTRLFQKKLLLFLFIVIGLIIFAVWNVPGPHKKFLVKFQTKLLWCAYWMGLGVLSSVGLGTGLHTFLLYLGPHIASVTMAAYECGSLDFPEPPYPDVITCPEVTAKLVPTLWMIMNKVRLESFMWGAGTALGELPPYFMARAATLSGLDLDEFDEIEITDDGTFFNRAKLTVRNLVEKVGFFGILACASIPNPLFDLAGITCGHFLVPFWTFFGATLIGKAVIKMHVQMIFVIIVFNEGLVHKVIEYAANVPYVGSYLQGPFKEFLEKQKEKMHSRKDGGATFEVVENTSWLSFVLEKVVAALIVYFVLSIVNSMAQSYHKRMYEPDKLRNRPKTSKD